MTGERVYFSKLLAHYCAPHAVKSFLIFADLVDFNDALPVLKTMSLISIIQKLIYTFKFIFKLIMMISPPPYCVPCLYNTPARNRIGAGFTT